MAVRRSPATWAPRLGLAAALVTALMVAGCAGKAGPTDSRPEADADAPRRLFYDGADPPQPWTTAVETQFDMSFPATTHRTLAQTHPFSAGWHVTSGKAASGSQSWTMVDERIGGYHNMERVTMTSPPIDASGVERVLLRFDLWGEAERFSDELVVLHSKDGTVWEGLDYYDSTGGEWQTIEEDISASIGPTLQLGFLFASDWGCSTLDGNENLCAEGPYVGFFVDNIEVVAHATAPAES